MDEHFERVGSSDEEEADSDEAGRSGSDDDAENGFEAGIPDSDGLIGEDSDEEHQRRRDRKQASEVSTGAGD